MRSIRRSLLGYFLVLLALTLGAIAAFVDRYAVGAVKAREESESQRIRTNLKSVEKEQGDRLNDELTAEARIVAREALASRLFTPGILGGRGGPGAAVRPVEEDVVRHHGRVVALMAGLGMTGRVMPFASTLALGDALGPQPVRPPGFGPRAGTFGDGWPIRLGVLWSHEEVPRVVRRVEAGLRQSFRDDDPSHKFEFQVQFVVADRAGRHRYVATAGSPGVGATLPEIPDRTDPSAKADTEHHDIAVAGREYRQVVLRLTPPDRGGGGQLFISQPVLPATKDGPGPRLPLRATEYTARVSVQCVVPLAVLDERTARDRAEAEADLARVRLETRDELYQLRTRLALIGAGSFLALVAGGWLIVARGLAPVRTLSEAVSRVSEKDFALPVDPAALSVELAPIHARLTQTLDQLRAAFAREKEAVADISHELRTPIASLLTTIEVTLRKPRTPDQYRTTLEDCRGIAKQLGQLVDRIITLASLDAGHARGAVSRVDAAEVADRCAVVIRPLAEAHGLTFTLTATDPAELDTDPDRLREIVMNLLHNAVEYNRPGGTVELVVRPAGKWVVFEVRDTGIGMTPEVLAKIFERFYRADPSRTATGVHAGLGLAIVKEYVERLGGKIEVESTPDDGSVFRVSFPAAPVG